MAIKKYNIEIPKMDYNIISIGIKNGDEFVPLGENDLMFMTVNEDVEGIKGISSNEDVKPTIGVGYYKKS